jgi:hypothetical protein
MNIQETELQKKAIINTANIRKSQTIKRKNVDN